MNPPTPAFPASTTHSLAKVYLCVQLSGAANWSDFDQPWAGLCPPDSPGRADPAWFLPSFARMARDWGLDGIVLYTPGVADGLYRLEHRAIGLAHEVAACNGARITQGLIEGQRIFEGDWLLYRGQPTDSDHDAWRDHPFTEGNVIASFAPYYDAIGSRGPVIRADIEDGSELMGTSIGARMVRRAIDHRWPLLKGLHGAESHPLKTSGGPYSSSLTMRTLLAQRDYFGEDRVPPDSMSGPTLILERCPPDTIADYAGALDLLRAGRSYTFEPSQVGYRPSSWTGEWGWASPEYEAGLRAFVGAANAIRDGFEVAAPVAEGMVTA